jgi:sensor histidine kinase YesM
MQGIRLRRRQLYWLFQLSGWTIYVVLNIGYLVLENRFNSAIALEFFLLWLLAIALTQSLRTLIIQNNWLQWSVAKVIPLILLLNILMAIPMQLLHVLFRVFFVNTSSIFTEISTTVILLGLINFALFFFLWSLIYFAVHYLDNIRLAEIRNLRWHATIREAELNKLKSQLNPHFMFNAMNSIRALVDENPQRAKTTITELASLLRNTLQMGRQKVVSFDQELETVQNYLAIEGSRFEERLTIEYHISQNCSSFPVPPLMIQTLVENGIKHGIAKLPQGGFIRFDAAIRNEILHIQLINSGQLDTTVIPESGYGLRNTRERLNLLYGNRARFEIKNQTDTTVLTYLSIPKEVKI